MSLIISFDFVGGQRVVVDKFKRKKDSRFGISIAAGENGKKRWIRTKKRVEKAKISAFGRLKDGRGGMSRPKI